MGHAAPIARFALAYAAGVAVGLVGAPPWTAPLVLLLALAVPIDASARHANRPVLAFVGLLGFVAGMGALDGTECVADSVGATVVVEGRFLATPRDGSAPFARADGCGDVTVVLPRAGAAGTAGADGAAGADGTAEAGSSALPRAGSLVRVSGVWREGRQRPWLQASATVELSQTGAGLGLRWGVVAWRDGLVARIGGLYGERAPVVSALVLARREGLDPDVRDTFAVSGIAHLLAISGFHVGVIAGLLLTALRAAGVGRRYAALGAAGAAWAYVGLIGFPDAACRAALILTLVAGSRARGRPPSRWGALAVASLVLLFVDASKLASPGFQLSFAGAGGLVAWAGPLGRFLDRHAGRRLPRSVTSAVAAGLAATLATLPIVAWHFERVSAVGIPMTLVATPLVTLALPGALLTIALDFVWSPAARFLAGGVTVLLDLMLGIAEEAASWSWASVWTSRTSVIAGLAGTGLATAIARRPGIGGSARRLLIAAHVTTGVLAWPVLVAVEGRGALELLMIDVGQGDAVALRSPAGRWILVDAGVPLDGDPRGHPVVRTLRARGVDELDAMILTHADADHYGGAEAVLASMAVSRVLDPALPVPKRGYADLIAAAAAAGVPWSAARAGQRFDLDGVSLQVLSPSEIAAAHAISEAGALGVTDANPLSVVVLVSWRGFEALLTGDADVDVERAIVDEVGDIDLLKVGHHGSDTSTDSLLLAVTRPEIALISVGRRNRYGHPSPAVLQRLTDAGARVHRTDLEGTIRVVVRRDGTVHVGGGRAP